MSDIFKMQCRKDMHMTTDALASNLTHLNALRTKIILKYSKTIAFPKIHRDKFAVLSKSVHEGELAQLSTKVMVEGVYSLTSNCSSSWSYPRI